MSADLLLIIYEHSFSTGFHAFKNITKSQNVLIAAISRAHEVTGTKRSQFVYSRKDAKSFGCSLDLLNIMPTSFLSSDSEDCYDFVIYAAK